MREPLDPDLATLVADYESVGIPPWHSLSVDEARALEADLFTPDEDTADPVGSVGETVIESTDTNAETVEIDVRVYTPETAGPHPMLVFCHGGGWMLGTLDSADDICRGLCRRMDRIIVSVDYRLAPEHPFPAGLADAICVYRWCREHGHAIEGNPDDVAVGGTSAGGNLTAGVARFSAEFDGTPTADHQVLLYPMLDCDPTYDSYTENEDAPFLCAADVAWFWKHYFRHDVDSANPYAVPMHATEFAPLPPVTIATAGHDPLRDEAFAYADDLVESGVEVTEFHYPSLCHGFLSMADDVPAAAAAFDDIATAIN